MLAAFCLISLKIKDISVYMANAVWRNFVIVKVTTDDGIVGYGEGTLGDFEKTIEAAIIDYKPHLIGKEVNIPAVTRFMYQEFYWHGGPMLMSAISAIEQALWDISAKAAGVPVYKMLGGNVVDRVRTYVNGFISGSASPEEFAAAASKVVKMGFNAMKFDPFEGAGPGISNQDLKTAVKRVEAVRNAIGENNDIIIEAHGRFDPATAVRVANELRPYAPMWFEEPIREDNFKSMAEVRAKSPVTIATGERLVTKFLFNDLLAARGADIVQPDVCHMGGIRALCDVASMADANYVSVAPHNPNGPIATAATLNTMLTMSNGLIQEFWIDSETVRRDLIKEYFDLREGYLYPSSKPGLGIEVNEDALTRYPYKKLHLEYYTKNYKYHGDKA